MRYMVVECCPGYAVVLDEEGRFLKVANLRYEVGQTVTDVVEMKLPQTTAAEQRKKRWLGPLAAMAACLVLVVTSVFQMDQAAYASVYMAINPEVRIDVNRRDVVVGLEGINADGKDLIEGYWHKKKDLTLVMDELVDRAIDMGYLHEGGKVTLTLDTEHEAWIVDHGDALTTQLNEYLSEKISVTIEITNQPPAQHSVTIPVPPSQNGYGEDDYGEEKPPDGDTGNAVPEPPNEPLVIPPHDDGQTDYGPGNDPGNDDGQTSYEPVDHGDDGQSPYGEVPDDDPEEIQTSDDDGPSPYGEAPDDDPEEIPTSDDDGPSPYGEAPDDDPEEIQTPDDDGPSPYDEVPDDDPEEIPMPDDDGELDDDQSHHDGMDDTGDPDDAGEEEEEHDDDSDHD